MLFIQKKPMYKQNSIFRYNVKCNKLVLRARHSLQDHDHHSDHHEGDASVRRQYSRYGRHEGLLHDHSLVHEYALFHDLHSRGLECIGQGLSLIPQVDVHLHDHHVDDADVHHGDSQCDHRV